MLANTSVPHSVLKKKSSSIAYHFVREGVAKDAWRTAYLHTDLNPADMGTKSLPGGIKKQSLYPIRCIMWNDKFQGSAIFVLFA